MAATAHLTTHRNRHPPGEPSSPGLAVRSRRGPAVLAPCLLALALAACSRAPKEVTLKLAAVGEPLRYDKPELKVPANSRVTLTLTNAAPGAALSHNFVLVQPGTADAVGVAAASAGGDREYIPSHYAVIANSPPARPGEKVTVSFLAPPAGSYEFLCTVPSHAAMRGTFLVQ